MIVSEIIIRIFWGPWGGELNPSPIVSVGNTIGVVAPSVPALVKEEQSWMIKTDDSKTVFSCYSKEPSINSDDHLQLLVCAIMPKGKILADMKSPLNLLEDVRSVFDRLFTFDLKASLPSQEEVNVGFAHLLEGYALTDCPWYVFNMEGKEPASYCVEDRNQLDALMRFNAYPALAHVSHLEIGYHCKSTVEIKTKGETDDSTQKERRKRWVRGKTESEQKSGAVSKREPVKVIVEEKPIVEEKHEIVAETDCSKPKGYQVVVNGQPMKDPMNILWEGSDKQFLVRCDSTLDYRYEPLPISIDKLRKAVNATLTSQDGNSKAVLDENSQSVICTLKPIPKWYQKSVMYDIKSDDEAESYCKQHLGKDIQILVGGQEWADKIQPSRFNSDRISISPEETDSYCFSISKVDRDPSSSDMIRIYIKANKKRERKPLRVGKSLSEWWKKIKSPWIIAAFGFVLGGLGFWAVQTMHKKTIEKNERKHEEVAWSKLEKLTPKNPQQAMLFRNYLKNYSNGEIYIGKGNSDSEKIFGSFDQPNAPNIGKAKIKLQNYLYDSIQAERDEERAFNKCVDITACSNYLSVYNPVQTHQYFNKGKHVEDVLQKLAELQTKQKNEEKLAYSIIEKELAIKKDVEQKALDYLNNMDLHGFRDWMMNNNSEWFIEFNEKKKNKELLRHDKCHAVELILEHRRRELEIRIYLEEELGFPNKPFKSWNEVLMASRKIDEMMRY